MMRKFLNAALGIVIALLIGALIMLAQGYDPLASYAALFQFSLGNPYALATTLKNAVPLVLTGLSAAIAFASGPVNLGQPGQLVMGALAATVGGLYLDLPPWLMIPALALLAMAGGALWAGLAALLRQAFQMSEFIVTLMLNIIADYFAIWAITYPLKDATAYSPMTPPIARSGWLPEFGDWNSAVFWMLAVVALMWFLFNRTRAGYEWRIGGQNSLFARLGGCRGGSQLRAGHAAHRCAGRAGRRVADHGRAASLSPGAGRQLCLGWRHDRHRRQQQLAGRSLLRTLLQRHPDRRAGYGTDHRRAERDRPGPAGRAGAGHRRQP